MELFDQKAKALARRRALSRGPELFLHERAFADVLERLEDVHRDFARALLIGTLDPAWRERIGRHAAAVEAIEIEDLLRVEPASFDLCVAVEGLDTLNELPHALLAVRFALRTDSLFIGALPGGDTLPALRAAMRVADERMGGATPHVHPRIEPSALASMLSDAGFAMPVVDVDRVETSYRSLSDLVRDLRSIGATNQLSARARTPLTRSAAAAAASAFDAQAVEGRVRERFEILHFAAWTPARTDG